MYHTHGVWLNPDVEVFEKLRHLTNKKHVYCLPWLYISHITHIVCIIFLMYVATIQCLNNRRQETKPSNLQHIVLTHLWPWNSQSHQTYNDNVDCKQSYNQAKFERSYFNGVWEKTMFSDTFRKFSKWGNLLIISPEHVCKWKIVVYMHAWSTWWNQNHTNFQLSWIWT